MLTSGLHWDVLLVGGHSTSGKSTLALQIGRQLQVPVVQVDDFRIALQRATSPGQIEGLHLFLQPEEQLFAAPISRLVESHIRVAQVMSHAIEAVVAHHVLVRQPIIIEGDGILPELAVAQRIDQVPVAGRVKAVFVCATSIGDFKAALRRRWPAGGGRDAENHYAEKWTELAWHYGQWQRGECIKRGVTVIDSEPFSTLAERAMENLK
jgi:2-phosphoglycerate kinase